MDGMFVSNISIGVPVVKSLRKATDMFLDVHLMIEKPVRYIDAFADAGADLLSIHLEADMPPGIRAALDAMDKKGVKKGIVLRPITAAEAVLPYVKDVDLILVMTVDPPVYPGTESRLPPGGRRRRGPQDGPARRGSRRRCPGGRQRRLRCQGPGGSHSHPAGSITSAIPQEKRNPIPMEYFPPALEALVEQFARLPGIGRKTAQRLAFFVLSLPEEEVEAFAQSVRNAKHTIALCPVCQNLTEGDGLCPICASDKRDGSVICVVADPKDVIAMERAREYNGRYHVLHGVLSPMNGVGPDDLHIKSLLDRVAQGEVREVIMATNPDTEGEATAMYLSRLLKPFGVKVTRLAYGVPVGGHLEYADDATLMRALEGRREI